jgi:hypothetical protein
MGRSLKIGECSPVGPYNHNHDILLSPKSHGFTMVQSLSQSCALPSLIQYGLSDKIIGGSLVTSNEIRNNYIECSPLSFIYRYTSTTFEVRDILHLESVYALLTIHDLPTPDRHQV